MEYSLIRHCWQVLNADTSGRLTRNSNVTESMTAGLRSLCVSVRVHVRASVRDGGPGGVPVIWNLLAHLESINGRQVCVLVCVSVCVGVDRVCVCVCARARVCVCV